ncbi:MAG TPA: DinB family protein [Albitalea sp.]|nr:DinB family protein [Albitalea sp.]
MRNYFATLARYHLWATQTLFEQMAALPDEQYRRDAGLFFRSVHGTLNHLLVGEWVWYPRFAEGVSPKRALDEEVESDRARLRERLLDAASRWSAFIAAMPAERFDTQLDYTTTKGIATSLPVAPALGHVFNHGTHHRGQISAALTAMGHAAPELDLVIMLQAESRAHPKEPA